MEDGLPNKKELGEALEKALNTLSDDAQNAALRKCTELGFDTNKGRISLEETLINLSHSRDILLDAVQKKKLGEIPLKLQYDLLEEARSASKLLASLTNGADEVINLENAVEELTASIWQFGLQNLSGQVLGFQNKMNQLKAQETQIRRVSRDAEDFEKLKKKAESLIAEISDSAVEAEKQQAKLQTYLQQGESLLKQSSENEQKAASLAMQIQQTHTSSAQHLASATLAVGETEAIATKSKELRAEIETSRTRLTDLTAKTEQLITTLNQTHTTEMQAYATKYTGLVAEKKAEIEALAARLDASVVSSLHGVEIRGDGKTHQHCRYFAEHLLS